jgi:hypothetical protein
VCSSSTVVMLSSRKRSSCCASRCNFCLRCMRRLSFWSCFSFSLSDLSERVYVRSLGGVASGFVVIVVVLLFVLFIFLGPWSSSNEMKVLSFGITAAAVIVLFVLPFTTSIHSPSSCSLSFSCPPHRQSSLSSVLSSLAALALCFGHFSSFPFSSSLAFTNFSPICLHTALYR